MVCIYYLHCFSWSNWKLFCEDDSVSKGKGDPASSDKEGSGVGIDELGCGVGLGCDDLGCGKSMDAV